MQNHVKNKENRVKNACFSIFFQKRTFFKRLKIAKNKLKIAKQKRKPVI